MTRIWDDAEKERVKLHNAEINAEFDRLEKSVPYGVCYQCGAAALRQLKTPEEGRAFYAAWRNSDH